MIVIQWLKDLWLEVRIQATLNRLLSESDRNKQREIAAHMAVLCRRRSPRRVVRMEEKAGLR